MFGQFDVLHQLDIGIEVEGWRQNAVQAQGFGKLATLGEVEQLHAFDRPSVGHARHPSHRAKRHAFQQKVIHAAKDVEPIAERVEQVGHAADIAGFFFDGDNFGNVGQALQCFHIHIDAVGDGVVVDHDWQVAGGGDGLVPSDGFASVGAVGKAGEDHHALGPEPLIGFGRLHRVICRKLRQSAEKGNAACDDFLGGSHNSVTLALGEGCIFAQHGQHNDARHAAGDQAV